MLPKEIAKLVPKTHLMSEAEWRSIGVQQSQGWKHYMIHEPGNILQYFRYQTDFVSYENTIIEPCKTIKH